MADQSVRPIRDQPCFPIDWPAKTDRPTKREACSADKEESGRKMGFAFLSPHMSKKSETSVLSRRDRYPRLQIFQDGGNEERMNEE